MVGRQVHSHTAPLWARLVRALYTVLVSPLLGAKRLVCVYARCVRSGPEVALSGPEVE